jgi:undecaprenyl-diphosphatase
LLDTFQAIILGIVQGLTEFIPVSSSAHLIFVPYFLGWPEQGLSFSVALHLGTFVALLVYFWRDIAELIAGLIQSIRDHNLRGNPNKKIAWLLLAASIPGGIAGILFDNFIENLFHSAANVRTGLLIIATLMVILGALMLFAEHYASHRRKTEEMRWWDAIVIGLAQAIAILPGASRSGGTITAGLFLGIKREDAARFSFLMAIPAVGGAGVVEMPKILAANMPAQEVQAFVAGFLAAAVVGYLCVKYLLQYLRRGTVDIFAYYRFAAAIGIVVLLMITR